eukprot:366478-Chlamydomonas_euryale.AAC.9
MQKQDQSGGSTQSEGQKAVTAAAAAAPPAGGSTAGEHGLGSVGEGFIRQALELLGPVGVQPAHRRSGGCTSPPRRNRKVP